MHSRKIAVLVVIFSIAFALFLFLTVDHVPQANASIASSQMTLRIAPSALINNSMAQGEGFVVNVTALDAVSLHGFSFEVTYDQNIIECTHIENDGLMSAFGNTILVSTIDNANGRAYVSVNLTSPEAVASGNGSLIELSFSVKGVGETNIGLANVFVHDSNGALLPCSTVNGYFNNKLIVDFAMPFVLFVVTFVSVFLNGRVEGKLKSVMEEREFRVQDAVLLVGLMSVMIYLVVFVREITLILMALFLFAYSMLLFTFTYVFSKNRWYIAILPPAVFILLYVFVRDTPLWTLYLVNIYGLVFAVLITLYLASLFTWKTTAVFGVLITAMDIVLVLVTGTMVQAAEATRSLSLPVMVSLPIIPLVATGNGLLTLSLGLGDFFFAGLLGVQTLKKYGKRFAVITIIGMTTSFFIFEVFLLNYLHGAFPGTLMIICGWAPLVLLKELVDRRSVRSKKNAVLASN